MDEVKHIPGSAVGAVYDLLAMLQDQCGVVSRILNDVLSLQKMEEGRFTLEMVPFSPEHLLRNTVESFAAGFQSRHQSVSIRIQSLDSSLPAACNDIVQLGQALLDKPNNGDFSDQPLAFESCAAAFVDSKAMLIGGICAFTWRTIPGVSPLTSVFNTDYYRLRQVLSNFLSNGELISMYEMCSITM